MGIMKVKVESVLRLTSDEFGLMTRVCITWKVNGKLVNFQVYLL